MPAAILPLVWREISRLNRRHRLGEKHGCGNSRALRAPRSSTPMSWRARWSNPATKPGPRLLTPLASQCCNRTATLDRQKLRTIIFDDPDARKKLESIIHPRVRALAEQRIREHAAAGYAVIVYEVPLLFEGNLQEWLRPVILVACDVDTQRNRLAEPRQSRARRKPRSISTRR